MDIATEKSRVRAQVLAQRDSKDVAWRRTASENICDRIRSHQSFAEAKIFASYVSFRSEFDTNALNRALITSAKHLLLPRMVRQPNDLRFYEVSDLDTQLVPGKWGILEPDPDRCMERSVSELDWLLVPGVAFDRSGARLGYGGGFYDRVIARTPARTLKIAAAFGFQLVDNVPTDLNDQRVDCIVTEAETISIPRVA